MADIDYLQKEWLALSGKYSQDHRLNEKVFSKLSSKYQSRRRHYHNFNHIEAMLRLAEGYENEVTDYDALRFAIWFHDAIYRATRNDNEQKSADLASKSLSKLGFPNDRIQKVNHLILRTKNHFDIEENEDFDTQLMLDIDLMILSCPRDVYVSFIKWVRAEYKLVPKRVFVVGRIKILKRFQQMPQIYRTEKFVAQHEQTAKENLAFEIQELKDWIS